MTLTLQIAPNSLHSHWSNATSSAYIFFRRRLYYGATFMLLTARGLRYIANFSHIEIVLGTFISYALNKATYSIDSMKYIVSTLSSFINCGAPNCWSYITSSDSYTDWLFFISLCRVDSIGPKIIRVSHWLLPFLHRCAGTVLATWTGLQVLTWGPYKQTPREI